MRDDEGSRVSQLRVHTIFCTVPTKPRPRPKTHNLGASAWSCAANEATSRPSPSGAVATVATSTRRRPSSLPKSTTAIDRFESSNRGASASRMAPRTRPAHASAAHAPSMPGASVVMSSRCSRQKVVAVFSISAAVAFSATATTYRRGPRSSAA